VHELAGNTGARADALRRLLRCLAAHRVFRSVGADRFELSPAAQLLRTGAMRDGVLLCGEVTGDGSWWNAVGALGASARSGEPAFDRQHGMGFFDYMARHPQCGAWFDRGLANFAAAENPAVAAAITLPRGAQVVDVGGGQGGLLAELLHRQADLRATLFAACGAPSTAPRHSDHAREARWASEFETGLVVGDAIRMTQSNGHRFVAVWASGPPSRSPTHAAAQGGASSGPGRPGAADGAAPSRAVVLVDSIGVHPDHGLTQRLRTDLFDAGYATLSIQAPVVDMRDVTDANVYAGLMDEAAERIDLAITHVRARGAPQVFLVGHTTGAWMVNHFLARRPDRGITARASLRQTGALESFGANKPATLDLYPDGGSHWARTRAPQRLSLIKSVDARSQQLQITGTDLSFAGAETRVRDAIVAFFGSFQP
jgi:hypothetical protein